jgi:hypothetical protein
MLPTLQVEFADVILLNKADLVCDVLLSCFFWCCHSPQPTPRVMMVVVMMMMMIMLAGTADMHASAATRC